MCQPDRLPRSESESIGTKELRSSSPAGDFVRADYISLTIRLPAFCYGVEEKQKTTYNDSGSKQILSNQSCNGSRHRHFSHRRNCRILLFLLAGVLDCNFPELEVGH